MVYIDESGAQIERYDLMKGYLVDAEWIEHPEVPEKGHYVYEDLKGGGRLQRYIVDTAYQPARREVTVMKYILYTEEELALQAKADHAGRLEALELQSALQAGRLDAHEAAYLEGVNEA